MTEQIFDLMDSLQPTAADFRATEAPVWANNEQEMLCLVYTEKTWLQLPKGVFFSNRLMHKSCQLSLLIGDLKLWGKPRDREGATACLYVEKSTYQNPKWHSLRRT